MSEENAVPKAPAIADAYKIDRQGKTFVLYAGLVDAGYPMVKSIETERLEAVWDKDGEPICGVFKATITTFDGRAFTGIGDATRRNVGGAIRPHLMRMAETRAKARACRDMLNVGAAALEEIGDDEAHPRQVEQARTPRNSGESKVRPAQVNRIKALADERVEGGYKAFRENVLKGKDPSEITPEGANKLIKRLMEKPVLPKSADDEIDIDEDEIGDVDLDSIDGVVKDGARSS